MLAILVVLAPVKAQVLTALVLIGVDFITGIWAARKRGEKIASAGLSRTAVKCLVYETAIVMAFLTEAYLMGGILPVLAITSSFIGLTELKSILENLNSVSGQNLLSLLIAKLSSKNAQEQ